MRSLSQPRFYLTAMLSSLFAVISPVVFAESAEEYFVLGQEANDLADMKNALFYYRQAAELNHAPAQAMLGRLLDAAELNDEARQWYQQSADQGDINGQLGLALMLVSGEGGDQDFEAALHWYTMASENGSLRAMRILEQNYRAGGMGLKQNPERADYWLNRAAAAGDRWSIQQLEARAVVNEEN